MKKFTSVILKLFFLVFVLLVFINKAGAWGSGNFTIVSENTTDGKVVLDLQRYSNGNLINDNLYLQVFKEGVWTNIYHTRHYVENGNKYTWNDIHGYVDDSDLGQVSGGAYVFRLTINGSPTNVYNSPVSFRWVEENTARGNFSLTFYKPEAPRNFTVSKDLCNVINLSWD